MNSFTQLHEAQSDSRHSGGVRFAPPGGEVARFQAFMGLAPFLRMSIAGIDLLPTGRRLLAQARKRPQDAELLMNLSMAMLCMGQRESGLSVQAEALRLQPIYRIPAAAQPARLQLLVVMAPGDLSANTPIDCLLEDTDVDLTLYFAEPGDRLMLPPHDVLMVAVSECDDNRMLLAWLAQALRAWPRPVINTPPNIVHTARNVASALLHDVPGLLIPPTVRVPRPALVAAADGTAMPGHGLEPGDFPVILRPVDSHAGRDLEKIASLDELAAYLARVCASEYFLSSFVDYSGADGQFRKYRIALVDGEAHACHMGMSSDWMIHYVNAGMYEDAAKRAEEARFMERFGEFALRHRAALAAAAQRCGLDYLCIDCAETRDGRLLIFEIDHAMVVHAMDSEKLFPYKQVQMRKVRDAFRAMLLRRAQGEGSQRHRAGTAA